MLTMLIGGLWHGASWRFVVWGGVHGAFLVVERLVRAAFGARPVGRPIPGWARLALVLSTYLLVCLAWVFFRSPDLGSAVAMLRQMFRGSTSVFTLDATDSALAVTVIVLMLVEHWILRDASLEGAFARLPSVLRPVLLGVLLVAIALSPGDTRAFIYFQF
jgi:D-alanyl-lipoteichoic acid acyltransferase DltB (MBOAT superfamily)